MLNRLSSEVVDGLVPTVGLDVDAGECADVNGPSVGIEVRTSEEVWMFGVSLVEYALIGVRVVSGSRGEDVELILAAVVGATIALCEEPTVDSLVRRSVIDVEPSLIEGTLVGADSVELLDGSVVMDNAYSEVTSIIAYVVKSGANSVLVGLIDGSSFEGLLDRGVCAVELWIKAISALVSADCIVGVA